MVIITGKMNERLRNIVQELLILIANDMASLAALPVDAGDQKGLLAFPQKRNWIFYNTNPNPMMVSIRQKASAVLVQPDGTTVSLSDAIDHVQIPHGAWLKLSRT